MGGGYANSFTQLYGSTPPHSGGSSDPQGFVGVRRGWNGKIESGTRIEFVPSAANGLGDFRRIGKGANGQDIIVDLDPSERVGQYSDSNRDARRARREREDAQAETRRLIEEGRASDRAQRGIDNRNTTRSLDLQGAQIANQGRHFEGVLNQIIQQGRYQDAQLREVTASREASNTLERDRLNQNADFQRDEVAYRNAVLGQQGQALQDQNRIAAAKLMYDDKHFQQQMELDKRNGRRTQVLGALSLIAQSAARL